MKKVLFYIICTPLAIISIIGFIVYHLASIAMRPIYKLFKYEDEWNYACQYNEDTISDFWVDMEF